jgi:homoserine O-succinyltransferase
MQNVNPVKVAIVDLYNNIPNQGMRSIQEILTQFGKQLPQGLEFKVYDTRHKGDIPSLDYDVYVSTGGPGSPYDGHGLAWESHYFKWVDSLWNYNQNNNNTQKKHAFFICHSFQMVCRHFEMAQVTKRHSTSFGVFPTHKTEAGNAEILFKNLPDPFHVADFRDWQAVQPNHKKLEELGASILCMEKIRPHVDFERALMAIRISDEMFATQFHPEADPVGMSVHFSHPEKEEQIVMEHGKEKYDDMLEHLNTPDSIPLTHNTILPTFLSEATRKMQEVLA